MRLIRGCEIPDGQFACWESLFIYPLAPYFYSDAERLSGEHLILSRQSLSAAGFPLSFIDAYKTYAVSKDASWVAMLTPQQFDALPANTQAYLLAEQCRHSRGQVYAWPSIESLPGADSSQAAAHSVDVDGTRQLVFDAALWAALTSIQQQAWLVHVIEAHTPHDSLPLSAAAPENPRVQRLANTFADISGPNCFSTTLAAITEDAANAETIANFWLHQEPFLNGLARRGFALRENLRPETAGLTDCVLVWRDDSGQPQHACYLIADGIVLNKDAQTWFSPRQLLPLQSVLDVWQEDGYAVVVYARSGT